MKERSGKGNGIYSFMCGICGIINFDGKIVQDNQIQPMIDALKHRGPDDEGLFLDNNVGLGHARLSIIDLTTGGHQPMFSHDGRYCIVFNGEIYNYLELKDELSPKYAFKTESDTEVILAAYQEWGEDCLHRFNGMFAFVIYDTIKTRLLGARDRFGIKPFYYFRSKERLIFASEIKGILPLMKGRYPNDEAIYEYLVYNRTDQSNYTFFKDIYKLLHGHCISIDQNGFFLRRWYDLKEHLKPPFNSPEEFRETFLSSIDFRLRSDVPVGACLSGGLDSSSIVSALVRKFNRSDIHSFSAVYGKGIRGDESNYIDEYKHTLRNMHFVIPSADDFYDDIDDFVDAHSGEPVVSPSTYAGYKVFEAAKSHVKVTLDGQGADEYLGGYHYFFGHYFKELLREMKILCLLSEIHGYLVTHKSFFAIKTVMFYLLPIYYQNKHMLWRRGYLSNEFVKEQSKKDHTATKLYKARTLKEAFLQHFEYKLEHLLKWLDHNSMHFSVESRVPFLDHRLVENSIPLESSAILRRGTTKSYLRKAMKTLLPHSIRARNDKMGFETPAKDWFKSSKFEEMIYDTLNSSNFKNRGYIDSSKVLGLYKVNAYSKRDLSDELWKCINLELWFRKHI